MSVAAAARAVLGRALPTSISTSAHLPLLRGRLSTPLLHRVLTARAFVELEAEALVSIEDPLFAGHFPGNPIYPGVLSLEMLIQGAALLTAASFAAAQPHAAEASAQLVALHVPTVEEVKFRAVIRPGDRARVRLTLASAPDAWHTSVETAAMRGADGPQATVLLPWRGEIALTRGVTVTARFALAASLAGVAQGADSAAAWMDDWVPNMRA